MKRFIIISSIILVLILSSFKTSEEKIELDRTCCKCKDTEDKIHAI